MEQVIEERIYFQPGDVVELKQDIPYKPKMIVVKKEANIFKKQSTEGSLRGIRCMWFTSEGALQEGIFNTKDLVKVS